MRRIAVLTAACLLAMIVSGCNDDGRTLPEPGYGQDQSISTSSVVRSTNEGVGPDDPGDGFDTVPPLEDGELTAPWREGADIDARYTCDSVNVAPALSWSDAPEGTVEIAITLTDLDVPGFVHWALAGLSPTAVSIAEDTVPIGAYEGANSLGDTGYTGPCPPAGQQHLYLVTVHYLGVSTGLDDGAPGLDLIETIETAEISRAQVTGIYSRA